MKYYIILITILFSSSISAHEWKQDYWLETFLSNRVKLGDCWSVVNEQDIITFRKKCSLWAIGYRENVSMKRYHAARDVHPDLNTYEFIDLHFPEADDDEVWLITQNMELTERVAAVLVGLHIAEGLTRSDK